MHHVGVVHMDLMAKGGGEAVAMNVLEALADEHDVTLLTLTEPDFDELDDYFNTDVEDVSVRQAGSIAPAIQDLCGLTYYVLQNALLGRYARRHADEFDLLVSTINELGLGTDAIQYVHFPFDWTVSLENREHIFHPTIEDDSLYERLCTTVASVSRDELADNRLLANSRWTADVVEDAYGMRPEVCYPPVDTDGFENYTWTEREQGFVTLGRIERSKRIVEMIEILDGVRDRGHDVHLHVVGPTVDEDYRTVVEAKAAGRPYVSLEGEISRESLVDLVSRHRYGIHGKRYEHFGMAVAELAAGGTVPFVPATGGQRDVVGADLLRYETVEGAVDAIDRVLDSPALQHSLRMDPGAVERRFGRERFQAEIRGAVAAELGADRPRRASTPPPASVDD